jgi:hypothetical protein
MDSAGARTVNVAAVVDVLPAAFVKTALYRFPFCDAVVAKLNVTMVAPAKLVNVTPAFVLTCHCTVGAGDPVAAAVKVAMAPANTDTFVGFVVITGRVFTVSVAAVVVADPCVFVKTASYEFPVCAAVVVKLKVAEVAPATAVNAPPPVLTIHCTVGVGVPLAAAVNVAVAPAVTVRLVGFVVITGADGAGVLAQPATNTIIVSTETPSIRLAKRLEPLRSLDFWNKFRILETMNAFVMAGLLRVSINSYDFHGSNNPRDDCLERVCRRAIKYQMGSPGVTL